MKIEPEVSQLDFNHTVAVADGISVPALIVRRASTTVELRDGQSFVIGGLLQSNNQNADRAVALARQRAGARRAVPQRSPTRRTRPTWPSSSRRAWCVRRGPATCIKTPLDDSLPPNDVDFFLMGKTELTAPQATRSPEMARFAGRAAAVHRAHARSAEAEGFPMPRSAIKRCAGAGRCWRVLLAGCSEYTSTAATPSRSTAAMRWPTNTVTRWSIRGRATAPTATSPSTASDGKRGRALPHRQGDPAARHRHQLDLSARPSRTAATRRRIANNTAPLGPTVVPK